ncbi:MAG: hypothetical protein CSA35_09520 [Dethiosulfovibrio peptidovorans]|nr:MAG: hypothetical protein CSA35_09520 [Dethiosulfovibrio peptidovorans]
MGAVTALLLFVLPALGAEEISSFSRRIVVGADGASASFLTTAPLGCKEGLTVAVSWEEQGEHHPPLLSP